MIKIYHNPRCAKSRAGLKYIESRNISCEVIDYIEKPLTAEVIKRLIMKLNIKPVDLVRTNDEVYKKELKGRNFTNEEWIKILEQNPRLIKRPVVEGRYKAVIAIPETAIDIILKDI